MVEFAPFSGIPSHDTFNGILLAIRIQAAIASFSCLETWAIFCYS